jgi:hypothetical protein
MQEVTFVRTPCFEHRTTCTPLVGLVYMIQSDDTLTVKTYSYYNKDDLYDRCCASVVLLCVDKIWCEEIWQRRVNVHTYIHTYMVNTKCLAKPMESETAPQYNKTFP